jgi:hypothetical protein
MLNSKLKTLNPKQITNPKFKNPKVFSFGFEVLGLFRVLDLGFRVSITLLSIFGIFSNFTYAQGDDLELTIDTISATNPLPDIFKPSIDLSGRGYHRDITRPQTVADKRVIDTWQKDIGLNGIYRLQYSLWEISQLSKNKDLQDKLLANYDSILKTVSDNGGVVIVNIFGTPAGAGRVLDPKSPPRDLKQYAKKVKEIIRELSCIKKYNIWYEVWNSPDSDNFFLGKWTEYLNVYRFVAGAVKQLEAEYKINIPLGGPSVSWWYQNSEGNTIITPENSLIYELIRYCYHYRLPLDFISWHGYSSDPAAEKATTIYKQTATTLVRTWLNYFHQIGKIPFVIDEWNYDRSANVLPERNEKSYIASSYIPARIKNMHEAGIDHQVYFCLEDFQGNKEGVVRNVGVFSFDSEHSEYRGSPKAIYNVFKMLNMLGNNIYPVKLSDDFVGSIATKTPDGFAIILYNYIDPDIVNNYLTKNICTLNSTGRKILLNFIRSGRMDKILKHEIRIESLGVNNRLKTLLKNVVEVNDKAKKLLSAERNLKLGLKNLKDEYSYQRYVIDSSCQKNCEFKPVEEKDISSQDLYHEDLALKPYSVQMIVLKKKIKAAEEQAVSAQPQENPASAQ